MTLKDSDTVVGSIAEVAMDKPDLGLFGVDNGANPLEVLVPLFTTKSIQQSTPFSAASNTLTVTLVPNYNLKSGSTVTISGLTGSQTEDSNSLSVTSTGNLLGTSGTWTQAGSLMLTVGGGGVDAGFIYKVSFVLTNSASDYPSPSVSVEAQILNAAGDIIGSIAKDSMTKPGEKVHLNTIAFSYV